MALEVVMVTTSIAINDEKVGIMITLSFQYYDKSNPWQQGSWGKHGAQLGPTGPSGPHVDPMNYAYIWDLTKQ